MNDMYKLILSILLLINCFMLILEWDVSHKLEQELETKVGQYEHCVRELSRYTGEEEARQHNPLDGYLSHTPKNFSYPL